MQNAVAVSVLTVARCSRRTSALFVSLSPLLIHISSALASPSGSTFISVEWRTAKSVEATRCESICIVFSLHLAAGWRHRLHSCWALLYCGVHLLQRRVALCSVWQLALVLLSPRCRCTGLLGSSMLLCARGHKVKERLMLYNWCTWTAFHLYTTRASRSDK